MELYLSYVLGVVCIAVYGIDRFNTPPIWRSTTTSLQYHFALFGYLLTVLFLFFIVAIILQNNPEAIDFFLFSANFGDSDAAVAALPASLISALLFTTLLPNLPLLKKVDGGIQMFFREIGAIPRKARQLIKKLRNAEFETPTNIEQAVQARISGQDLDGAAMIELQRQDPRCDSMEASWVRISALFEKIEHAVAMDEDTFAGNEIDFESGKQNSTSRFVRHQEQEYAAIKTAYGRQATMASIVLNPARDTAANAPADFAGEGNGDFEAQWQRLKLSFRQENEKLFREMTRLISCGVLNTKFRLRGAYDELTEWGFKDLNREDARLTINDLVAVICTVFVFLFAYFLVLRGGQPDTPSRIPLLIVITLSMGAAIVCAIKPKRWFPKFARRDEGGARKYAAYLVSGLVAVLFWAAFNIARFSTFDPIHGKTTFDQLSEVGPFALLPLVAAFIVAGLADNSPANWPVPKGMERWIEGLILAAALGATMFATVTLLHQSGQLPPDRDPVKMMFGAAGIGFIMGFMAPTFYRRTRNTTEEEAS
jgi:hypothetical protein